MTAQSQRKWQHGPSTYRPRSCPTCGRYRGHPTVAHRHARTGRWYRHPLRYFVSYLTLATEHQSAGTEVRFDRSWRVLPAEPGSWLERHGIDAEAVCRDSWHLGRMEPAPLEHVGWPAGVDRVRVRAAARRSRSRVRQGKGRR